MRARRDVEVVEEKTLAVRLARLEGEMGLLMKEIATLTLWFIELNRKFEDNHGGK